MFFQVPNAPKPVFGRGSALDPTWELTTLTPVPLVDWGGDTPSAPPDTFPLSTPRSRLCVYGASVLRLDLIPIKSSGYAYVVREEGAGMIFLRGGGRNLRLRYRCIGSDIAYTAEARRLTQY